MTAETITLPPLTERLEILLDYMAQGAYPPGCCADCAAAIADRCDMCAQTGDDFAVINAAIGKVQQAPDETEALKVYMKTVMRLAGFPRTTEARS